MTKRAKSFKARHAKNIAKGKMSAAYWANRVKMVKPQQHQRRLTKQELKKIKQQQQLKKHNQLKKDETQIRKST